MELPVLYQLCRAWCRCTFNVPVLEDWITSLAGCHGNVVSDVLEDLDLSEGLCDDEMALVVDGEGHRVPESVLLGYEESDELSVRGEKVDSVVLVVGHEDVTKLVCHHAIGLQDLE